MNRELTPEEEKEYSFLFKKLMHTVFTMSKKDWERFGELSEKKYGTAEEIAEEIRENRRRFYKFQEQLSKKQKNKWDFLIIHL